MQRYRGLEVRKVEIKGIDGGLAGELKTGLELSGVQNLIGADRARFYSQTLRQDLERARLFLAREGYPRAELDANVTPHGDEEVDVVITVQPGVPVRVARVDLFGFPRDRRSDVKERILVERGKRFRDADVDASVAAAKLDLENAGYARAAVEGRIELLDSLRVVVTIDADPGPVCRYREVRVDGTKPDLVKLVRRSVGIDRGALYSVSDLERARDRLRLLGLFRQVRLELLDSPGFDHAAKTAEVDLVLHLSDRPPRSLEAGVGYWSEDGVRVQGRWQHRNLLLGGRGFEVGGLFSDPRREVETSLWWPALFRADVRGELAGHVAWQYEESFDARRRGGDLSFVYRPNLRSTIRTSLEIERVTINRYDPAPDEVPISRETQIRLAGQWSFDNTDDRLDPTRGQLLSLQARKVIPTGLTQNDFVVYEVGLSQYVKVLPKTVLAARTNIGWARALEGDLPEIYRFFAGGATSMRGYRRNRLGPVDANDAPIGGEAKLEMGAELRIPIWKGFKGDLFLDAAQVWANRKSVRIADLETAAGGGLIYSSPVGPVRIDVGFPLQEPPADDPDYVIHVLVGHPF
ncbi:MAG: BamA/TamA family outer membrane protein [Candidatus Eisenbacteria bacterium]